MKTIPSAVTAMATAQAGGCRADGRRGDTSAAVAR
jgi:hypothetical protein